jgi:adenylate cyclase
MKQIDPVRMSGKLKDGWATRDVTVLLADLRGFSAIVDSNAGRKVVEVLNRYLVRMCEIADVNGGTIDKFIGDSVMLIFNAPIHQGHHARHAVTCAVQMQLAMEGINRENASGGFSPLYMGVGINSGRAMAGPLGPPFHVEYTVLGDNVNVASRIESFSLRGQVLIGEATFKQCDGFVTTKAPMDIFVKGKSKPVRVREVLGIPSLGLSVPRRTRRESPRVEAKIPFTYHLVVDKIVLPKKRHGMIRDIGYQGVLAEVSHGLKERSDLRLDFDLSLIGREEHDIYGKVCKVKHEAGVRRAGIAFTSTSRQTEKDLRYFVQLLMQGSLKK